MLNVTHLTIHYGAKRSANFQTADVSAEMTVSMAEGDKICDVFRHGVKKLSALVNEAADAEIRVLCNDDHVMKGGR